VTAVVIGLVGTGLTANSASAAATDTAVNNSIRRFSAENGIGKSSATTITPRIVGGSETTIGKAPYMVQLAVILGGTTYRGDLDGSTEIGVKGQWVQPSYRPSGVTHDIAVLTLNGTLPYTPVKTASASDSALYAAGTNATPGLGRDRHSQRGVG
jgi:secreted trypsin-like serine protease